MTLSRLALGTVQLGMPYGVANRSGQPDLNEAAAILHAARSAGIDTLDTAVAYGESEAVLGKIGIDGWHVVSKLPAIPDGVDDVGAWVDMQVRTSLARLGAGRLSALLLHRPDQLHGQYGPALLRGLEQQKYRGLVEKIGLSIYAPEELDRLADLAPFDVVQAPLNVLDRRMIESGWALRLRDAGIEFHARSIFLQGLLLMTPDERPERFRRWDHMWRAWEQGLADQAITPLQACMHFAFSIQEASRVVVGVDHLTQLREIIAGTGTASFIPPVWQEPVDADLINPARWSQL